MKRKRAERMATEKTGAPPPQLLSWEGASCNKLVCEGELAATKVGKSSQGALKRRIDAK